MMDVKAAEDHLKEIKSRLAVIEKERDVLSKLAEGYEGYLQLLNGNGRVQMPLIPNEAREKRSTSIKGTISFRSALVEVLKDARGAELSSQEILRRALALGAVTNAKSPVGVVDLSLIEQMKRNPSIRKTAPRTFKWVEEGKVALAS